MQLEHAKLLVRVAAVIAGVVSIWCLGFLVRCFYELAPEYSRSGHLIRGLAAWWLASIMPCWFIHTAVQAWRFKPKGIVSLSSGYLLFGFLGFVAGMMEL